jgi:hypothetical protein
VVYRRSPDGIFARRFDSTGMPVGSEVMVTGTDSFFDAWSTDDRVVVVWIGSGRLMGLVVDEMLSPVTPSTTVTSIGDFTTRVAVVATGTRAIFAYNDSSVIRAVVRSFPSLTGTSPPFAVVSGAEEDFELALYTEAGKAFLAYVDSGNIDIQVIAIDVSAGLPGGIITSVTNDGRDTPQRMPYPAFAVDPTTGARRLAVAYSHSSGALDERLRMSLIDVALDGSLTLRDTVEVAASDASVWGLATFAGGRWFVPFLQDSVLGRRTAWGYAEVRGSLECPRASRGRISTARVQTTATSRSPRSGRPEPACSSQRLVRPAWGAHTRSCAADRFDGGL